jgi:transposase
MIEALSRKQFSRPLMRVKAMNYTSATLMDESKAESSFLNPCQESSLFLLELISFLISQNAAHRKEIDELTSRLNQNSNNSNRPPSSNSPFKKPSSRTETKSKIGAKKGHEGHGPVLLNPNKIVPVKPERCECGNTSFPKTHPYYTHQEIELPPTELDVTHFVLFEGVCPQCGKLVKAGIPGHHAYGYGPRLTALVAELSGPDRNSRGTVQTFFKSVMGISISRGGIQRCHRPGFRSHQASL